MSSLQMPAGEAKALLAPHGTNGRHLVLAASLVGDEDDFGVWSWRCKDWRTQLASVLKYVYGAESARTFQDATRAVRHVGGWQTALGEEVANLHGALAMLDALSKELCDHAGGHAHGSYEPAQAGVS